MKVRWSEVAARQLERIERHIERDDPRAAVRLVDRLIGKVGTLSEFPRRGRHVPELPASALRELIVGTYRVVYRVGPDDVTVLTVFEGHRLLRRHELSGEHPED